MALLAFLALVAGAALFGVGFPPGPWYESLAKPPGTPPNGVFPVTWTLLYLLMALAAWRLWLARADRDSRRAAAARAALWLWGLQLVLNAAWSWIFFGLHRPLLGLVDIATLTVTLVLLVRIAGRARPVAARMLLPYLLWVGYATWLNAGLWWLNR